MTDLLNNEVFGLLLTISVYLFSIKISNKFKNPLLNPLLLTTIIIIGILLVFKIPLSYYELGGNYIKFFLGPATVVLALPLYRQLHLLKKHFIPIIIGIIIGSLSSLICVFLLARLLHLDLKILISLLPKSITTPIGISISEAYGGIVSLTITAIVITGITGSITAPWILKIANIKNDVAKGIAIGTASHAVGTSKAIEMGETIGAMSGLAIALAGTITALLMPIFSKIFL